MNKQGSAGAQGGLSVPGAGGVAGPTAGAVAQAAQRQRSLLQRADSDIGSLLDNFSHNLKAARINNPVRNSQEAFQMEVHAARVVQAADSLLQLVSELKQSPVFSDFLSLNRSRIQNIIKFEEQSQKTDRLLVSIGEEVATSLQELQSHYYASPRRTFGTGTQIVFNSTTGDGA